MLSTLRLLVVATALLACSFHAGVLADEINATEEYETSPTPDSEHASQDSTTAGKGNNDMNSFPSPQAQHITDNHGALEERQPKRNVVVGGAVKLKENVMKVAARVVIAASVLAGFAATAFLGAGAAMLHSRFQRYSLESIDVLSTQLTAAQATFLDANKKKGFKALKEAGIKLRKNKPSTDSTIAHIAEDTAKLLKMLNQTGESVKVQVGDVQKTIAEILAITDKSEAQPFIDEIDTRLTSFVRKVQKISGEEKFPLHRILKGTRLATTSRVLYALAPHEPDELARVVAAHPALAIYISHYAGFSLK